MFLQQLCMYENIEFGITGQFLQSHECRQDLQKLAFQADIQLSAVLSKSSCPISTSHSHWVLTIWCQISDAQWAPVVSGVVDHHLRRVAAVPNSDSVAVYTEGCVQWSYPADGDRGVGGGGGQIERLRWWRLCRQLIVQTHMYSIQCSISDNVYTYNNGSFGHLLVPRALICPQILINYLLQWFFQAYWH